MLLLSARFVNVLLGALMAWGCVEGSKIVVSEAVCMDVYHTGYIFCREM